MNWREEVWELRKAKALALSDGTEKVGVNFTCINSIRNGKLDFSDYPSEKLIRGLARIRRNDEDELFFLAEKIADKIKRRALKKPDAFRKWWPLMTMPLAHCRASSAMRTSDGQVPLLPNQRHPGCVQGIELTKLRRRNRIGVTLQPSEVDIA